MSRFVSYLLALGLSVATLPGPAQTPAPPAPAAPAAATPSAAPVLAQSLPPLESLTARQVDNLAALGQVWGLLKYFHPAVAAGQRDWDAELLRQLPAVLNSRSVAARSRLLGAWVSSLGPVPPCPGCAAPPALPIHQRTDLRWAQDARRFSGPLRRQLAAVAVNRYLGPGYYVGMRGHTTLFPHEEAYPEPACPAPGLRVLGLVRYWNMLQYYYPYRYALDEDWTQVLPALLPRFAAAATPLAYRHAALALFARVHDGHARFYPPDPLLEAERGPYQVAADLQFLDEQPVVLSVRRDGLVPACPLEPGDVLTHLAGVPVAELVAQRLPETGASNRAAQLHVIAQNLLYCPAPQLAVQVLRAGQPVRLTVPAVAVGTVPPAQPAPADSLYRFLTPEVGYVDMARISAAKLPAIMRTFARTRGIVIDQRNYPGGFVATLLPGYFLTRPVVFAGFSERDPSCPGRFLWQPDDTLRPQRTLPPYAGRVVVLVDERSRSLAEFTAMALRATPHAILLGSPTAGADGNTTPITLPGGLKTLMTGVGIYHPDRRETQRVGLIPDVRLRPTPAGLRAGRDELRDRAVEIILQAPASGG